MYKFIPSYIRTLTLRLFPDQEECTNDEENAGKEKMSGISDLSGKKDGGGAVRAADYRDGCRRISR